MNAELTMHTTEKFAGQRWHGPRPAVAWAKASATAWMVSVLVVMTSSVTEVCRVKVGGVELFGTETVFMSFRPLSLAVVTCAARTAHLGGDNWRRSFVRDVVCVANRSSSLEVVTGAARTAQGDDDSRGACGNVSVEMVAGAAHTATFKADTLLLRRAVGTQ